jgi:hypothetical protein
MSYVPREFDPLSTVTGRWLSSAAAVAIGVGVGCADRGRLIIAIAASACLLAAMNGYSKSYSP